jgi:hypothetical protein
MSMLVEGKISSRREPRMRGPAGNERLTATTAVLLLALLATEGVTILFLRPLLSVHVFVGMLLIPPVLLKLGSTAWRFVRYYAGDPAYRLKGPPHALMRIVVAPAVVLSTAALFTTGVLLLVVGPRGGIILGLHKASFVVWLAATGVHVLVYVFRLPALVRADWSGRGRTAWAAARLGLVVVSLAAGAVLAAATLHLAQPWLHWVASDH